MNSSFSHHLVNPLVKRLLPKEVASVASFT
jgi:hypothetical protein